MPDAAGEHGEVHCLLCGRYLADVKTRDDGRLQLYAPPHATQAQDTVRLVGGRLHCGRCGGRAFVEWDLSISLRRGLERPAA